MSLPPPRILHLHSTFDTGGKEVRCTRLINAWGRDADHAIVSGDPVKYGAAQLIDAAVKTSFPLFPPLQGRPTPGRLKSLAEAMAGYDLICTYNWGAIDAVMAHTLFADTFKLAPLVHHEDGFNEDEIVRLKTRRNWYRRIALGRSSALVVPSRKLERIALEAWQQPRPRVQRIGNGIDTRSFAKPPKPQVRPGLVKAKGSLWLGSLAGLREVKNLAVLVRALPQMPPEWQLVIAGEGPERAALEQLARDLGVAGRVHLPGFVDKPEQIVGLFDIFALSSHSEQFPISVVEAMAAGVPVVAPRVGDITEMVSSENCPLLCAAADEAALVAQLRALAGQPEERRRIGAANRAKAVAEFDAATMIRRYRALYWGLMGR
jgi:glycosyltransferase involved in cell wall biosynthesis